MSHNLIHTYGQTKQEYKELGKEPFHFSTEGQASSQCNFLQKIKHPIKNAIFPESQ